MTLTQEVLRADSLVLKIPDKREILLNFTIFKGERVVLMGPSGCGKTSILKALAGLFPLGGKALIINNINVIDSEPAQRNLSFVFQGGALFPHLSVFENLELVLKYSKKYSKLKKQERIAKINHCLIEAGFDPNTFSKKLASGLSGGERQRVAIIRALIVEAPLVLMDEPFNALDEKTKNEIMHWMKNRIEATNTTLLFVTHNSIEAEMMATKKVIWKQGDLRVEF
jgi:ABC-type sugar transport system ATPase subunit